MQRRLGVTLIAVLVLALSVAGQSPPANPRLDRLKEWMSLVARHQPGKVDEAAEAVRLWTRDSLQDVRDDLYALRRLRCSTCTPPATNVRGGLETAQTTVESRKRGTTREWVGRFSVNHLDGLSKLAVDFDHRDINDILKRGALLHTDIVLRTQPLVTWAPKSNEQFLQKTSIRIVDGRQSGVEQSVDHMAMARRLLDIVTPDPRRDAFTYPERDTTVRDWYRGTMAVLLDGQGIFVNHEKAALEIFPADEEVLFQAGALHEVLASAQYQRGVTTRRVASVQFIESDNSELRRAEQLFRQALAIKPGHLEARLRLGQVLGQRGQAADALVELRKVDGAADDQLLSYFAALLIGREEGTLNNVDAARAAYQRAAALFPRAQSPRIGLSELAMRVGNRTGAAEALDVVWKWGAAREDADDPWQYYPYAAGRGGEALLAAIGAAFPPAGAVP